VPQFFYDFFNKKQPKMASLQRRVDKVACNGFGNFLIDDMYGRLATVDMVVKAVGSKRLPL
jgi:hypothetical protein